MNDYLVCFALVVVVAAVLAFRARSWVDLVCIGYLVTAMYTAFTALPGKPKPVEIEMVDSRLADAELVAHHLDRGRSIYVWLLPKGGSSPDPIAYRLPWLEGTARQLHEATRRAEQGGGTVRLTIPLGDGRPGGEPSVDWVPPAPPPPKTAAHS